MNQTSRTLLQLCQDVVADLGVTGGVINATQNLTSQEQVRIVNWVIRAAILIQQEWSDWNFMYYTDTLSVAAGAQSLTTTFNFNDVDHLSLVFNPDIVGVSPSYPTWQPWRQFQVAWQNKPKTTQAIPTAWSIDPGGNIWLSHIVSAAITCNLSYWQTPVRMAAPTDTCPIPQDFDVVIVERAKMLYGQRENASEILTGSTAEYSAMMDKLESAYLPSGRAARKSQNDHTTNPDGYVE